MKFSPIPALSRVLFDTDMIMARFMLGASELTWFILLIWPGETFTRPTYFYMRQVAPEHVWALLFLVTGLIQIGIVFSGDLHSTFARNFANWNAFLWATTVGMMLFAIQPPPAAISGEIVLAITAVWICVRPYILMRGIEYARATG
jgi:hypothetical protein